MIKSQIILAVAIFLMVIAGLLSMSGANLDSCYEASDVTIDGIIDCLENKESTLKLAHFVGILGIAMAFVSIIIGFEDLKEVNSRHYKWSQESLLTINKQIADLDNHQKKKNSVEETLTLPKNKDNPEGDFACILCNKEFKEFCNKCPSCGGFVVRKVSKTELFSDENKTL